MNWSNLKPTVPGIYYYRETADALKASVVVVDENNAHYAHEGFYFGPLTFGSPALEKPATTESTRSRKHS